MASTRLAMELLRPAKHGRDLVGYLSQVRNASKIVSVRGAECRDEMAPSEKVRVISRTSLILVKRKLAPLSTAQVAACLPCPFHRLWS